MFDDENELEDENSATGAELASEPEEPIRLRNTNNEEESTMAGETLNKLKRSALLHYVNENFDATLTGASWFLIGKHVSDMSVEMNPDTETVKNILDETAVIDNGYEPSFDVDTNYADPSDGDIYEKLKDIVMNRKTGEACKSLVLEIIVDKTEGPFDAWVEEVIVKPSSYGGGQGGVRIPYKVSFSGNRTVGTATIANKVPTFTATT